MYTMEYLKTFAETLDLPEASRTPLYNDYATLLAAPGAVEEMSAAENKLFDGANWDDLIPYMDRLHDCSGLHRHVVDFLFLMAASERLRTNYRTAGLPDELFWDTIADLKFKLIECHDVYGIWGTFVAFWHPWFYTMRRFKLGRLQFEAIPFKNETPVTIGGYTVQPGDTVYNMHIPSCGPLTKEARLDAYKKAYAFYKKDLGDKPMVFVCHSWLLYPKNREILPATLNMVDFINDFHIYKWQENDEFYDKWRVFGKDAEKPDAELPEDTTQRRCFKNWLLAGKKTGEGCGIFLYDGETFTK